MSSNVEMPNEPFRILSLDPNKQSFLTILWPTGPKTIREDSPVFQQAIQAYREKSWVLLEDLMTPKRVVTKVVEQVSERSQANLEIRDGKIFYQDREIQNIVVTRVLELIHAGYPVDPMILFLTRLMNNPSYQAIHSLYQFLENKGLPVTDKGTFIAYKSCKPDYTDHHSGKFSNRVGESPFMPRNECDDNTRVACSRGFHVGSFEYANSYASTSHLMLVEVDPADVVSVPTEASEGKIRVCTYRVIGELTGENKKPLEMPIFQRKDFKSYPAPPPPPPLPSPPVEEKKEETPPVDNSPKEGVSEEIPKEVVEKAPEPTAKKTLAIGDWAHIRDKGALITNLKDQLNVDQIGNSRVHRSYRKRELLELEIVGKEAIDELEHRIKQYGFNK